MKYTVIGGHGFIGKEFARFLSNEGHEVYIPDKYDDNIFNVDLGTIIYCAGNGDCINQPFKVLEANLTLLSKVLLSDNFEKLVYLSSTRLYLNNVSSKEDSELHINRSDNRALFNLTKITGEELCLRSDRNCLIIRPSNVYGSALDSPLFLPSITRDAILNNKINMYVSKEYSKDYIHVEDLVYCTYELLSKCDRKFTVVNVASGNNVPALDISTLLHKATGCEIIWHEMFEEDSFPVIDTSILNSYVEFKPRCVLDDLTSMVTEFRRRLI